MAADSFDNAGPIGEKLQGVQDRLAPTSVERARAEASMWAAFDDLTSAGAEPARSAPNVGLAEIAKTAHESEQSSARRYWLLSVAASVLVVAGFATIALVSRTSSETQLDVTGPTSPVSTVAPGGPTSQTPATSGPTPPVSPDTPEVVSIGIGADLAGSSLDPGRYSITLDGTEVEFTLDRGIDIVEITDDQLVLGAPPLDENSAAILVTLASVTPIFDPGDPENWFEDAGVKAALVGYTVPGIRSDALILRPELEGCAAFQACIDIASGSATGTPIALMSGGVTHLSVVGTTDGRSIIVVGAAASVPLGSRMAVHGEITSSLVVNN